MDELLRDMTGLNKVFRQPIEMRINEMIDAVRSDIGFRIYGNDFDTLVRLSKEHSKASRYPLEPDLGEKCYLEAQAGESCLRPR